MQLSATAARHDDTAADIASAAVMQGGLFVVLLVIEMVSVAISMGDRSWTIFLLCHAAVLALLLAAILVFDHLGLDSGELQEFAFLTFVAGPVGAAAGILSQARLWRTETRQLAAWYETIAPPEDAAVTLVDKIIDGRLVSYTSRLPRRFDKLLTSGSPQEKRAVLAYLALEPGTTDIPEPLRVALRSPDQGVRVQAAAVAAHVRDKVRHSATIPIDTLLAGGRA